MKVSRDPEKKKRGVLRRISDPLILTFGILKSRGMRDSEALSALKKSITED